VIPHGLHAENMLAVDPEPLIGTLTAFFGEQLRA
jgi:hypothetical protein